MRNKEDLLKLLDHISAGEASDEEIGEYNRWCDAFQEEGVRVPDNLEGITSEMWEEVRHKLQPITKPRPLKIVLKVAAAAVLVLGLTFGAFLLFQQPKQIEVVQSLPDDKAPGKSKAILTLANGETVALDDVKNGLLRQQGNSSITKVDSGLLSYQINPGQQESEAAAVFYNTLSIPRGGKYRIVLPDGTRVWLNASSSIRYPTAFTGKERKVSITGEVYMEVTEDAQHPFVVSVRNTEVTVLGTSFNIMAYEEEPAIKTTLLEGAVRVSVDREKKSTLLRPGQQVLISKGEKGISVEDVEAKDVAAWIHGFLSLQNSDLREFMNQVSRWYDVEVVYKGKVPSKGFGGLINRDANLSDILSVLESAGIKTEFDGKKIIVLSAHS